jgi:transcriptional regulator with XRE-family HTH domain
MTVNERLAYFRKIILHQTQDQMAKTLCVSKGFLSSMEIADRKVSPRITRLLALTYGVSENWFERGEGEIFVSDGSGGEIEQIISLYKQLNPFFKGWFRRQLQEIIDYENSKTPERVRNPRPPVRR